MNTAQKHYPEIDSASDFAQIEEQVLQYWQQQDVFKKSVESRASKKDGHTNEFIFYDGPPFANGLPHYGHLLTGYVKDVFARYQTMQGKRVERRFGWDCHGLPAEMGAEKDLGISGRQSIINYGIGKFNDYCRTSVMKYTQEWEYYVTRQARWVDFKNDYKTMDKNYMESVIWAFKQLYDKGLIYEAYRVMPYSWAAETPLSNFETKLDNSYRERTDKAITVAFELTSVPEFIRAKWSEVRTCRILAWTTTPWTLPSNLALAMSKKIKYVAKLEGDICTIRSLSSSDESKDFAGLPITEKTILDSGNIFVIYGSYLLELLTLSNNLTYKPLFPYFKDHQPGIAFRILDGSDFVTDTDGTGIVHIAPGFGEDDQRVSEANGIELVVPVDGSGRFTDAIFDIAFDGSPLEGEQASSHASRGGYSEDTLVKAKKLRKNPTEAESKLWHHLQQKNMAGFKFRRQQPIGNYIADFYSADGRLIIEVDGSQHSEQVEYDAERTTFLEKSGYRVLRFGNNEVLQQIESVLQKILNVLNTPHDSAAASSLASSAPPQGGSKGTLCLRGMNVIEENVEKFKFGEANELITKWLKEHGQLIGPPGQIVHNYPHCWRTDKPLIYRAMPSWYVEVTKFRDRAVELNRQINWIPAHIRDGQMEHMLATAPDWSISRNRFWGTPIPVWRSKSGKIKVFGSIAELEAASGQKIADLHRPTIDNIIVTENGEEFRRVEDVFDCWFESGSMPFAQAHYPFENKEWFEKHFPADFITEYVGQTRGWFNTLIMLSTALFDKPPFKNCICHGVVLDSETGLKYSKRLKNYKDPKEVMDKFGADALRWLMIASPVMRGLDLAVDPEGKFIRDVVRLAIKPIGNAYNFFSLYANADKITAQFKTDSTDIMDRYILTKCKHAVETIKAALDAYDTPSATEAVIQFFEVLNNWYIRRNKERFWKEERDADKQAAYDTLYTVLTTMCRAAAPLLPLTLEEIYRALTGEVSVHLTDYPDVSSFNVNESLLLDMDTARDVCNAALALRNAQNIRVRQPLASLTLVSSEERLKRTKEGILAGGLYDVIKDEVNVKTVNRESDISLFATFKLQIHFPILGKRLPEKMKQIIPASKKGDWKRLPDGRIEICGEVLEKNEFVLQLEPKANYKDKAQPLSSNDALVILDTEVTPELEAEGYARDMVRLIQQARKEAGLHVSDRINLRLRTSAKLAKALDAHRDYIAEQVLASSLSTGDLEGSTSIAYETIENEEFAIGITSIAVAA